MKRGRGNAAGWKINEEKFLKRVFSFVFTVDVGIM